MKAYTWNLSVFSVLQDIVTPIQCVCILGRISLDHGPILEYRLSIWCLLGDFQVSTERYFEDLVTFCHLPASSLLLLQAMNSLIRILEMHTMSNVSQFPIRSSFFLTDCRCQGRAIRCEGSACDHRKWHWACRQECSPHKYGLSPFLYIFDWRSRSHHTPIN